MKVLEEFDYLIEDDKLIYLWNHGIFLTERNHDDYKINLYSLHDYFVELWYNPLTDSIELIAPFRSSSRLDPYINKYELETLFS